MNLFRRQENQEERILNKQVSMQKEIANNSAIMSGANNPSDDMIHIAQKKENSDLIRWQQQLDDELFDLILSFRSLQRDGDKIVPIIDNGKPVPPLCNHKFIVQIVKPSLSPFMSKNLINSNLTEDKIKSMQRNTFNDIADNMADNFDVYGIDFVNYDKIIRDMKNVVSASIYRALLGFTKKKDSEQHKVIRTETGEDGQEKKKGFLFFAK